MWSHMYFLDLPDEHLWEADIPPPNEESSLNIWIIKNKKKQKKLDVQMQMYERNKVLCELLILSYSHR